MSDFSGQAGNHSDTICAVATPPGFGGIGIIRVSGPAAGIAARKILGELPAPRMAHFARFRNATGETIDEGIALWFPAPNSFTGEDVLELQGHGGPVVLQMLLERLVGLGCRPARAGEFSERAFLNNKLDLAQAEAIADLITSGTEEAARAARRSLEGQLSERVHTLQAQLTNIRVFVEAAIDFPEEEIDFLAQSDLGDRLQQTSDQLLSLLAQARHGRLLHDGVTLAIVGKPNAGKSSVLNVLSGYDSAIVTDIPGTTRDILREQINIEGVPVHIADTAGIHHTTNRIEEEGVRRARRARRDADIVLLIVDASCADQYPLSALHSPDSEADLSAHQDGSGITGQKLIVVMNKSDLCVAIEDSDVRAKAKDLGIDPEAIVKLSALNGNGLDGLRAAILAATGVSDETGGSFSARRRHVDAIKRLQQHLIVAGEQLRAGSGELVAEELRQGQMALSEITGEVLPDDLLGEIFASFCIGK